SQKVEITLAVAVVEVSALASDIKPVKAERLQHLHKLRIQVLAVKAEILPFAGFDQRAELEGHLVLLGGWVSPNRSGGTLESWSQPMVRVASRLMRCTEDSPIMCSWT